MATPGMATPGAATPGAATCGGGFVVELRLSRGKAFRADLSKARLAGDVRCIVAAQLCHKEQDLELVGSAGQALADDCILNPTQHGAIAVWTRRDRQLSLEDALYRALSTENFHSKGGWLRLTIRDKTLMALPESFGHFKSLRYISHNHCVAAPEGWADLQGRPGHLVKLQELNLNSNGLMALPESFGNLATMKWLRLDDNRLTDLPESFGRLTQLQQLNLEFNQLTALPGSVGQLEALCTLWAHDNFLGVLPESFGDLGALRWLRLENNRLGALPESLGQLTELQMLRLDNNVLPALPASLGQLAALRTLTLHDNPLTALPECAHQLRQLRQNLRDLADACDCEGSSAAHRRESAQVGVDNMLNYVRRWRKHNTVHLEEHVLRQVMPWFRSDEPEEPAGF